ncbi:MAG: ferritin-like domain-containing protein [Deltaproteobacteria bacterium]|nr:ferritin-like domain-containing protein [Deltaproteobacteria bacterium]
MNTFKNENDKKAILEALELNVNEEFRATLQYICHRISSKGKDELLTESFKTAALDEMTHILFFSDLIRKYGGEPRFIDWQIDKSNDLKVMIETDLQLEIAAKQRYKSQLEKFKDYPELTNLIKSVLDDEEEHENSLKRYIRELS